MQARLLRRLRRAWGLLARLLLPVLSGLALRNRLPILVLDQAIANARGLQFTGARGPLTATHSKTILQGVEVGSLRTGIFERHLARAEAFTGSPLTTGKQVRLLQDGTASDQAMLAAIPAARDPIHMETCRLDDDDVGKRFADALIAKQRQGVQANRIRDSFCTTTTPGDFFQRLIDSGVRVLEFNPMNPAEPVITEVFSQRP